MTLGIMELLGGGSFGAAAPLEAFCVCVFKMRMCKTCWQQRACSLLRFSWSGAFLWMRIGAEGSWLSCTVRDGAEWGTSSYLCSNFFGFVSYLKKCIFLYLYRKGASGCATHVFQYGALLIFALFLPFSRATLLQLSSSASRGVEPGHVPLVCGLLCLESLRFIQWGMELLPLLGVSSLSHHLALRNLSWGEIRQLE